MFLVDDFGRQRMRPEDLLNRWIVPLESRVDYLTLHTGKKFQVPFDVLIVFATNLDPASLADEAFLRRIPYKIAIEDPTLEQFTRIFEMICRRRGLKFHPVMVGVPAARGTTGRTAGRCAPATRAICSIRSPRCAGTAGSSRPSPASCSMPPARRISSTTRCPHPTTTPARRRNTQTRADVRTGSR